MADTEILENQVKELKKYFFEELKLLKGIFDAKLEGRAEEVRIVLASACSTGSAINKLGDCPDYFYGEMIMLSRSFIEKIVNYCYLQVCRDEDYKKFAVHPVYRAFHNTNRSKHAGDSKIGVTFSGREELGKDPKIIAALNMFSATNPRKSWSDLSVDEKVALLAEKTSIRVEFFLLNTLSIYSNASEALHGSLYGCSLPTSAYTFGAKKEDAYENLIKNTGLLYAQLGSMIHEVIKLLSEKVDLQALRFTSEVNTHSVIPILKLIFSKEKE